MSEYPFGFNLPPTPEWPPKVARPTIASSVNLFNPAPTSLGSLLAGISAKPKQPRIFVSYQHSADQAYYNQFSQAFHDTHESVYDNSLRGGIRSNDSDYIIQRIRDEFITGTSCTIVLVGVNSYQRKYLDWEIKATLDKGHGLIGIQLPTILPNYLNQVLVPTRLNANINSGYAAWLHWNKVMAEPHALPQIIEYASSRPKDRIVNSHEIKKQNG